MQNSGAIILETKSLIIREVNVPDYIAEIENKIGETIIVHTGDTDSDEYDIEVKAHSKAYILYDEIGKAQIEAIKVGNYHWSIP